MQREARTKQIDQLKQNGFKMVKDYPDLYINETGNVYSLKNGTYLKPDKRKPLNIEKTDLNIPKLILQTFKGETYRAGKIVYIDGNKANTTAQNIKYSRLFEPCKTIEVSQADLMTAIRCYYQVEKRYTTKDSIQTRMFARLIISERGFFIDNSKKPYIEVFKTYIEGIQNSLSATAKTHGLTVRDCSIIVNGFTNQLISDILQDLKAGILIINDFQPRRKTETQILNEYNQQRKANGQKPLPLRKQSTKESLKEFERLMTELKNESPKPEN